jgi:hypothetical protein
MPLPGHNFGAQLLYVSSCYYICVLMLQEKVQRSLRYSYYYSLTHMPLPGRRPGAPGGASTAVIKFPSMQRVSRRASCRSLPLTGCYIRVRVLLCLPSCYYICPHAAISVSALCSDRLWDAHTHLVHLHHSSARAQAATEATSATRNIRSTGPIQGVVSDDFDGSLSPHPPLTLVSLSPSLSPALPSLPPSLPHSLTLLLSMFSSLVHNTFFFLIESCTKE